MEYREKQIAILGKRLNYAEVGKKGKIIVFIHGWANNWQGWIPLISHLEQEYQLYLLDLPGFGDSEDLNHYSVTTVATYVGEFIKQIKNPVEAIIGLSMGSFVTAEVARLYHAQVKSVVLISPVFTDTWYKKAIRWGIKFFLLMVQITPLTKWMLKKIIETKTVAYWVAKYINMYRFNRKLVDLYGMVGKKKMRKEAFVEMGISASSYDLAKTVSHLSLPTLLIYGRQDKVSSFRYAQKKLLPQSEWLSLKVIPQAGHVVSWEQPDKVAIEMRNFFTLGS